MGVDSIHKAHVIAFYVQYLTRTSITSIKNGYIYIVANKIASTIYNDFIRIRDFFDEYLYVNLLVESTKEKNCEDILSVSIGNVDASAVCAKELKGLN